MATINTGTDTAPPLIGLRDVLTVGLYIVGVGTGLLAGFVVLLLAA
jgi:hypothetical protein